MPARLRSVLMFAAVALVAGGAAPAARAAWSTPSILSEVQLTTAPRVDVTASGDALTAFNRETTVAARWRLSNAIQRPLRVVATTPNLQPSDVAAFANGDGIVIWKDAGTLFGRTAYDSGGLGPVRQLDGTGTVGGD